MAESEGFEPPVGLTLRLISSQVHSTELCQLSEVVRILMTFDCLVKDKFGDLVCLLEE